MIITFPNGHKSWISNEHFFHKKPTARDKVTPYLNEFQLLNGKVKVNKDFILRHQAYAEAQKHLKGQYGSVLDVFGGIGITAHMFSEEGVKVTVNDIDPDCHRILEQQGFADVFNTDAALLSGTADVVIADYNNFTMTRFLKGDMDSLYHFASLAKEHLVLNDCTIFSLRYGKESYERLSNTLSWEVKDSESLLYGIKNSLYKHLRFHLRRSFYWNSSAIHVLSRQVGDVKLQRVEARPLPFTLCP